MAKEYDIARASGCCQACRREFQPAEEFVAVLHDKGEQFEREDFCTGCWEARRDGVGAFRENSGLSCMPPDERDDAGQIELRVHHQLAEQLAGDDALVV